VILAKKNTTSVAVDRHERRKQVEELSLALLAFKRSKDDDEDEARERGASMRAVAAAIYGERDNSWHLGKVLYAMLFLEII
jgi:hypothetical protein